MFRWVEDIIKEPNWALFSNPHLILIDIIIFAFGQKGSSYAVTNFNPLNKNEIHRKSLTFLKLMRKNL